MFKRATEPPEWAVTQDDLMDVLGALSDIYSTTLRIERILLEEDDEETDS
jgi:hypothetical protein